MTLKSKNRLEAAASFWASPAFFDGSSWRQRFLSNLLVLKDSPQPKKLERDSPTQSSFGLRLEIPSCWALCTPFLRAARRRRTLAPTAPATATAATTEATEAIGQRRDAWLAECSEPGILCGGSSTYETERLCHVHMFAYACMMCVRASVCLYTKICVYIYIYI